MLKKKCHKKKMLKKKNALKKKMLKKKCPKKKMLVFPIQKNALNLVFPIIKHEYVIIQHNKREKKKKKRLMLSCYTPFGGVRFFKPDERNLPRHTVFITQKLAISNHPKLCYPFLQS